MLKRLATGVLMVLYFITASGFSLNLHYCFDRISSFQIDAPAKACTKGSEVKPMKCCKDARIEVKVKDAHSSGSFSFLAKVFVADVPKLAFADVAFTSYASFSSTNTYRGPPPPDIPVFIKNRTFRI